MEKVKINIVPKGLKPACYVSQNDNGRVVRFELFDELTPYTLDGSETITITVVRPDGVELVSSVVNTEDSYIDVVFNDDMTAIAGISDCKLTITDGETVIGFRKFDMNIEIDAYNGKDVVIETATGVIASFNTEVEDNALEYESEIPYNAEGYTGLRVINTRTAPVYDKTPYLFRKTPSGYGNSCIEKLNGLSVALNQLVPIHTVSRSVTTNGITLVDNRDGSYTFYTDENGATAQTNILLAQNVGAITNGHKYFEQGFVSEISKYYCVDAYGGVLSYPTNGATSLIAMATGSGRLDFRLRILNGTIITTPITFKPNVIDLTQMFGSTIADYIYSLETAQAGAGVAYFKNLFGADYYAYNAGELMSVKTSGRKTIGFNQFDKTTATLNKVISTNGSEAVYNNFAHSDYIRALPNTVYYVSNTDASTDVSIFANYNSSKEFIGFSGGYNGNQKLRQTLSNTAYIIVNMKKSVMDDINVNISDPARDGEYEPYNAVTYPLDPDLELRGIPKLDANNKLYGDGDIYESNGDVTRRYGIVDLGSLNWTFNQESGVVDYFSTQLTDMKGGSSNLLCKKYLTYNRRAVLENRGISPYNAINSNVICISDSAYTDAATFKASLDGVYLIYEKATPTSESADPFTDPQEARITEEFIDERSIPIPVGQDSIYGTDIEYQDIDFDTTIFGGNINAVDGVLSSEYNSDGSVKPTPEIIDITPTPIPVRAGDNVIFNSASGAQTIRYYNQED